MSEMPSDHCLELVLFPKQGWRDYSGGVSYLVTSSSIVSSSLRVHVFELLPLKFIFFLQ